MCFFVLGPEFPNFLSQFFKKLAIVAKTSFGNVINNFFFDLLVKTVNKLCGILKEFHTKFWLLHVVGFC